MTLNANQVTWRLIILTKFDKSSGIAVSFSHYHSLSSNTLPYRAPYSIIVR